MAFIPIYILILAGTIVIDYFAGIFIESTSGKRRKALLLISLIANIGILVVFKYYNFFIDNINPFLNQIGLENKLPYINIILPIGLSFHTFQAMSYTIEVYRGNQKAEKHFGIYSLYVMFYPQLVAGPIERPQNLLHQFREEHKFDYFLVTSGLKLMAWGLFKKVVVADRLAIAVDTVYAAPENYNSLSLIIAIIFFTFQIYCDFSGYSDMAIGSAKIMGFKLMINFNRPYASKNISEFWKRWHISLSTWFKDYLYISLGGNKVTLLRNCFNLLVVFILSGLWHGANWTFIVWGGLNGIFLIGGVIKNKVGFNWFSKFNLVNIFITFMLISFTWIFFRAPNLECAIIVIKKMACGIDDLFDSIRKNEVVVQNIGLNKKQLIFSISIIISLQLGQYLINQRRYFLNYLMSNKIIRWGLYYALVLSIVFFGVFENRNFIYFQF